MESKYIDESNRMEPVISVTMGMIIFIQESILYFIPCKFDKITEKETLKIYAIRYTNTSGDVISITFVTPAKYTGTTIADKSHALNTNITNGLRNPLYLKDTKK